MPTKKHIAEKPEGRKARKRTPKNQVAKRARRVAIVKGLVEQHRPAEIAQAIGVSRKTVYEELKAPETQELIRKWLEPYQDDVRALIPGTILAVAAALHPKTAIEYRLRAVKTLGVVMGWAQGKTDGDGDGAVDRKFSGTMEELLVVYRTLTAGESQSETA
jgi:transposase